MRKIVTRVVGAFMLFIAGHTMHAQMAGTYSVPGTFTSLAAAISSLNTVGVGTGGATISIAAAYTETAPVGGYTLTATGVSGSPIVFQRSGTGANPLISAFAGGAATPITAIQNGVFLLVGSDYVTFDGIDLIDPNTANPATMEYGFGFFAANPTNGCQYNTIKNCTVTLNRINNAAGTGASTPGSRGILLAGVTNTAQTVVLTTISSTLGANSFNKFYNNLIQNCNIGISLYGGSAQAFYDTDNDIGGTSAATSNTIVNYGGGATTSAAYAIYTMYQQNMNASYNVVNNNNGTGVNHATTLYGIYLGTATGANSSILSNTLTLSNGAAAGTNYVINCAAGSAVANTTVDINNNVIANCNNTIVTSGAFYGITNGGAAANVNINNNTFTNNIVAGTATGAFVGIYNTAAVGNLNINNNTFTATSTKATSGAVYHIYQNGAATASISIQNNKITWSHNGSASHSGAFYGVYNSNSAATATLNVSGNDFSSITRTVTSGSGAIYFINLAGTQSMRYANANTWTNLTLNHANAQYLITNSGTVTNTLTVNSNSIVGSYSRGTATSHSLLCIFNNAVATSTSGVRESAYNVFSNITGTLAGTSYFFGIYELNGGSAGPSYGKVLVHDNLISNIDINTSVPATYAFYGINTSGNIGSDGTDASAVYSNTITNINYGGLVYGYVISPNNSDPTLSTRLHSNEITNVNSAHSLYGVYLAPGVNSASAHLQAFKNKVANLTCTTTAGQVFGIFETSSYYADIYNNLVGQLYSNYSSGTGPSVSGIFINSGYSNIWHNTVYLDAGNPASTSTLAVTAANFASAAAYVSSANTMDLRNNILINKSLPKGTGKSIALWRSAFSLGTYSASSNNNLFYAGVPSASNVIYYDGSFSYQGLSTFQIVFAPRDSSSYMEAATPFLSTVGSATNFLHIDPSQYTLVKSNAVSIAGVTDDFDADIRQGNPGYLGGASSPDIGADEFNLCIPPAKPVSTSTLINHIVCGSVGGTTSLSATGTGTIDWYSVPVGGSPIGSGNSFTTPAVNANTIFYAAATTSCSSERTPFNVVLLPKPSVSIMTPTTTVCEGTYLSLIAMGDASTYTWSQGGGNAPAMSISPTVTATYTVVVSAPYGCTNTATQQIAVNPSPSITATAEKTVICLGESARLKVTGAQSYLWSSVNLLSTGNNIVVTPDFTTTYTVTGTNTNGCTTSVTVVQKVNACTGVNENTGNLPLAVYPNPTSGAFTLELNNGLEKTADLFDITGRLVMTNTSAEDRMTIHPDQLPNGVYYLRVRSNNTVGVVKVVKQ